MKILVILTTLLLGSVFCANKTYTEYEAEIQSQLKYIITFYDKARVEKTPESIDNLRTAMEQVDTVSREIESVGIETYPDFNWTQLHDKAHWLLLSPKATALSTTLSAIRRDLGAYKMNHANGLYTQPFDTKHIKGLIQKLLQRHKSYLVDFDQWLVTTEKNVNAFVKSPKNVALKTSLMSDLAKLSEAGLEINTEVAGFMRADSDKAHKDKKYFPLEIDFQMNELIGSSMHFFLLGQWAQEFVNGTHVELN